MSSSILKTYFNSMPAWFIHMSFYCIHIYFCKFFNISWVCLINNWFQIVQQKRKNQKCKVWWLLWPLNRTSSIPLWCTNFLLYCGLYSVSNINEKLQLSKLWHLLCVTLLINKIFNVALELILSKEISYLIKWNNREITTHKFTGLSLFTSLPTKAWHKKIYRYIHNGNYYSVDFIWANHFPRSNFFHQNIESDICHTVLSMKIIYLFISKQRSE